MSLASSHFHQFDVFTVDSDQKVLLRNGVPLPLAPKVFETLLILVENGGRIVEKEVLMNRLWPDTFVEESNLTFNIHLLRKALGDDTRHPRFIETVARRGYRFIGQARSASTPNRPNVRIIHKVGETDDGRPSIAMEHVEGVTRGQRMNESPGAGHLQASRLTTIGLPEIRRSSWTKRLALTGLILISITGLLAGIYKMTRRIEAPAPARFQRINVAKLTTDGNAIFGSISSDGKYVAYVKSENGQESLWLRQVASAGNLEVAPPREGHYQGIAFSPDGNSIYYGFPTCSAPDAGDIFKVPVLGTGAPPLKVNPENGPSTLSHDGKRIAFVRYSRVTQTDALVVARPDNSEEQTLVTRKWPDRLSWDLPSAPAWTNDDQNLDLPLVKSDASGFYCSIYELHLADRSERTIPLSAKRFEKPNSVSLLSDASTLVLGGRAQGASFEQIWYLGRDGSARPLTNDLSDYCTVSLTADSKSMAATQTQILSNIWVAPKGETAHAAQITAGLGRYFDLTSAPDGAIIFASDASGSADIYEMAANGSQVRQLTSGVKRNYAPAVSRDNRFIVFHSNRSGVFQVWRMDRDGNNPQQLTFGEKESNWPQFSADGKFVYYQHFEPGDTTSLWRVPAAGGAPAKVTDYIAVRPAISPDGKWLAFWQNESKPRSPWELVLFSLESGKVVKTFAMGPTVQINWDTLLRWNSDSQSLTYLANSGGVDNIWAQPIDGRPAKKLTNFADSKIFAFDWSREGTLVVSRGVVTSDVVLISDAGQ